MTKKTIQPLTTRTHKYTNYSLKTNQILILMCSKLTLSTLFFEFELIIIHILLRFLNLKLIATFQTAYNFYVLLMVNFSNLDKLYINYEYNESHFKFIVLKGREL